MDQKEYRFCYDVVLQTSAIMLCSLFLCSLQHINVWLI